MKPSRLARITLVVLCASNFINFADRQVIATLAPILKDTWGLSDTQVGLLSTAFEVLYALAPVPIAILADRWLRRKVISIAMAVWSGAMVVSGMAGSYWMLLLGRATLGLGEAGYGPSALAWISSIYPPDRRSRAVGWHDLGSLLGSATGYALGGVVGKMMGWRPVFLIAALPGFALSLAVWFLREPSRAQGGGEGVQARREWRPARRPVAAMLKQVMSVPTLLTLYLAGTLLALAIGGLTYWIPSYAVRNHGFSQGEIGVVIGVITILSGTAGTLSGGFLADWLLPRTPSSRLLVIGVTYLAGFPLATATLFAPTRPLFLILAALTIYLFTFYSPCVGPLIHQVVRPGLWSTATAVYLLIIHVLGYATAPAIVGWVSDRTGDLRIGMLTLLLTALVGGLVSLWGTRFVRHDARVAAAQMQ